MRISVPPLADRRRESRYYSAMVVVMALVVFAGIARDSYYATVFPLLAAWLLVLFVQATLVRTGNIRAHRAFGIAGVLLAAALVAAGIHGSLLAAARPGGLSGVPLPPQQFLIVPLGNLLLFALFVALAFLSRRGKKWHKRLMILATVNLLDAAIARLLPMPDSAGILVAYWLADLFIVALAAWDLRSLGRLHPATLWGGLAIIVSQPLRLALADSERWQALAAWAIALT